MKGDHVVCVEGGGARCLHCGDELQVVLPMQLDVWCAMVRAYVKAHKNCKPAPKEAGK